MFRDLVVFLGRLYRFFISLVVIAFLTVAAWFMWHFYEDEKLQNRFLKEGQVVEVLVTDVDRSERSFRDRLGNCAYVAFPYHQKIYNTRFVSDTTWVSPGDRIQLLYHAQRDEFRQQHVESKPGRMTSRLINWSSINGFNQEHKLLTGFLVVITSLFFFAGGVLVCITGWTFLQTIARFVLVIVLAIAALFFTYDTWEYYRYYQHVKTHGQPMDVTVLDTDKHRIGRNTRSSAFTRYQYQATFHNQAGEWAAPITADEYEMLKPTDHLRVLYDKALNDFMSTTYSGDYWQAVVPVFFWVLFLVVGWNIFSKSGKKT